MRYALNTVPINGTETFFGSGQADFSLSTDNKESNQVIGVAQPANMAMMASGAGYIVITGLAQTAAMQLMAAGAGQAVQTSFANFGLAAEGNGQVTILAAAQAANQTLTAAGLGFRMRYGSGQANMLANAAGNATRQVYALAQEANVDLAAEGVEIMFLYPEGVAELIVDANDNSIFNFAQVGSGSASAVLEAFAGIPSPIVFPRVFEEAHESRKILAPQDTRVIVRKERGAA